MLHATCAALALSGLLACAAAAQNIGRDTDFAPSVPPESPDYDRLERLASASPASVSRYVQRVIECYHWAGEEPYDRDRARQIARNHDRLNCDVLARDARRLRLRFMENAAAIQLLDEVEAAFSSIY